MSEVGEVGILSDRDGVLPERICELSSEGLEGNMGDLVVLGSIGVVVGMEEEAVFVIPSLAR